MRLSTGLKGLAAGFTLLAMSGCETVPNNHNIPPIESDAVSSQRLKQHVINYESHSVELNCTGKGTVEAELFKDGLELADYEYDLDSFSRKFSKHMRNLDRWNIIPKTTRKELVKGAEQITSLCDGP